MKSSLIVFLCPACGIKLTLARHFAGVNGPCPSCRTQIQAPDAPVPVANPPLALWSPPSDPLPRSAETASAAALRLEPRQLPIRSSPAELVAKLTAVPVSSDPTATVADRPAAERTSRRERMARYLMPLASVVATIGMICGVITFLKASVQPPAGVSHHGEPVTASVNPEESMTPARPVSEPGQTVVSEPPFYGIQDPGQPTPTMRAMGVLEKFLSAKTLEERLPLIESRTPESVLAASVLNRPLPEARNILVSNLETNAAEEHLDIYFHVDLATSDNRFTSHTILVRSGGGGLPRVVVDPFLDSFGGRLAAFAAAPSDEVGFFQVVVSAIASCSNETVPNRDQKLTLKLMSRDNTKEIARAYFGRQSSIGRMLAEGSFSLSYANAKAGTVALGWNTKEDPDMPYLEAIYIKSMDWNP